MSKFKKMGLAAGLGVTTLATINVINNAISKNAVAKEVTKRHDVKTFSWKLGNVSYTVEGKGAPLLLIHDLKSDSCSYEWKYILRKLAKKHKVYTIDLLGCGYSDKPNITYTAYMYTQLLNDFVVNVITHKVSVIATGDSVPLTVMAAYNNPYLFKKLILVSPQSIKQAMVNPGKRSNIRRNILNTPVIGTLIYNICNNRHELNKRFGSLFENQTLIPKETFRAYHEISHLGGNTAKYLYASTQCHYTTASIQRAISQLDNCIYIISGDKEAQIQETIAEYMDLNPAIEYTLIKDAKHLPQIENPEEFLNALRIYL